MAFDIAKIFVKAGDGGNGVISFRREKFVPYGGPDGGDGGRGGSVYLVADPNVNTLLEFQRRRHFRAVRGGNGGGKNCHGRAGTDLRIVVPIGTVVWALPSTDQGPGDAAERQLVADLTAAGREVMVARGGRGGLGNAHFATSTNQAPRIAQRGEPGEERWLHLELKLIADVGVTGYPNVGKSTLLAAISAARPKIADYPFTTLEPSLGVVEIDHETFVVADIPGLIEGAHLGVGLGHEFLRHVERTRILIHVVDGSHEDPVEDFRRVNDELALFNRELAGKPQVLAVNKIDLPEVRERLPALGAAFQTVGVPMLHPISAATGEGVQDLLRAVWRLLKELPHAKPAAVEGVVFRPRPRDAEFTVAQENGGYVVRGVLPERAVAMTDLMSTEARRMLRRQLDRLGVTRALERQGIQPGQIVRFGREELEYPW